MPNWCSNRLTVQGPPTALGRWSSDVAGTDGAGKPVPLDFERVLPTPSEFATGPAPSAQAVALLTAYFEADVRERQRLARTQPLVGQMAMNVTSDQSLEEVTLWDAGDWRTHNWGTKWPPAAESFRNSDDPHSSDEIAVVFSTAWTPPRPIVMELIQRYPDLSFDLVYSEPDDGFAGRLVGRHGDLVLDTETREPEQAVDLLRKADWQDVTDDWLDPDEAD